jgi:type 2 lantibiotic biosynthesis protein LanM
MIPTSGPRNEVEAMLAPLVGPPLAELADQLRTLPHLAARERDVVTGSLSTTLHEVVWRHVRRVVLVELHAARIAGRLQAEDSHARWDEWVATLAAPGGWEKVADPYPDLLPRLRSLMVNRCTAAHTLAERISTDRPALAPLLGAEPGELRELRFGAGDSHQNGQTVTTVRLDGGSVVYKPRSLAVDAVLGGLLPRLLPDVPEAGRIRVPAVLTREDRLGPYGWAEHVAHRYCRDDHELRTFYRGLGHWLAVMRLLAGSDLHSENLIACGPVPVVVDCETMFTPHRAVNADGYGDAVALAGDLLARSVLRTGILPGRGGQGGRRGADVSAAGALPGQQPAAQVRTVVGHGTDDARMGFVPARPHHRSANHPSPEPDLGRHWEHVLDGCTELTRHLHTLDRDGALEPLLAGFAGCPVRVVLRDTATYAELAEVLWHPSSLYEPEPAVQRVTGLLIRQAHNGAEVPDDPAVVGAEVADLLHGDIPVFTTISGSGLLAGPRGTRWGASQDLVAAALARWRGSDLETDRRVIRATLVSAYLNEGGTQRMLRRTDPPPRTDHLDRRRREQAALVVRQLAQAAVRGDDGTVTWVAPMLDPTGWAVRLTTPDLYNGQAGIAVLLAGYMREEAAGRADPVPDLAALLSAVLRTMTMAEDRTAQVRADAAAAGLLARPEPAGGYLGLGSRIWAWLLLHRLGVVAATDARARAEALAELLPEAVDADEEHDLLAGSAGAVVPLLRLAEHTGHRRWRDLASTIGARLAQRARRVDGGACWSNGTTGTATEGVAHGAFGIGWALTRLAAATGADAPREVGADGPREVGAAALAWGRAEHHRQRRQRREENPGERDTQSASWCRGAAGIAVCAADLWRHGEGPGWREVLGEAVRGTWPDGSGATYTLCHGDLGAWEVLDIARDAGLMPSDLDQEQAAAQIVTSVEQYGPATGLTRAVFQPGLFVGSGGVAYQLLRMHPDCDLPSVLLPDPGPNV